MKKRCKFLSLIPALLLWAMFSVLLWGSVFVRITDAPRENKITLYADAQVQDGTALSVALEDVKADGIRMVQARPFSFAMFDGGPLEQADLLIVPASHADTYREWLGPLPEEIAALGDCLTRDGAPWGLKIYDASTHAGAAAGFIAYEETETPEDYYLFFGVHSVHIEDGKAVLYAKKLLELQ
ncbi:MAG: hypothetical protein IKQ41_02680 [Clostridia bacterium]|nr:hypothetical protein [Clostridia bacterium]